MNNRCGLAKSVTSAARTLGVSARATRPDGRREETGHASVGVLAACREARPARILTAGGARGRGGGAARQRGRDSAEHFPTEQIDETFVVPAAPEGPCAFEIEGHFTAQLEHTHFFDRDGNEIRNLTRLLGATTTWSANGKSITDKVGGIEHLTLDPETGSATLTLTGLLGHLLVRGQGIAAQDSGRIVLFFEGPEDEEPDVLFERGRLSGGPFPALCEILAP